MARCAALLAALPVLLTVVAAPASAHADACISAATPGPMTPVSGTGLLPGPWTGALSLSRGCPSGGYFSSAAACTGYGIGVPGAYCDTAFTPATSPSPFHRVCTVYPAPGVTLTSVAAGWDLAGPPTPGMPAPLPGTLTGPAGPPDGHVDGWDNIRPAAVMSASFSPGPVGEMTVHLYPPPFPNPAWTYQIVVYAGAQSVLPGGLEPPMLASCH